MNDFRAFVVAWVVGLSALAVGAASHALLASSPAPDQAGAPRGATPAPGGTTQGPGAAQSATGLILGQVVDGETGQPIADAIVTVGVRQVAIQQGAPLAQGGAMAPPPPPPPPPPGARGAAGPAPIRLLTGSDGRFAIRDLPAGPVSLQASAPGYLAGNIGQSRPRGPARPLRLTPGQQVSDAVVRLWKVGVITGTVIDEAGEPVIGVNVLAYRRGDLGAASVAFVAAGSGRTDDRGVYRLSALAPGDYIVMARQTHSTVPTAATDSMMQSLLGGAPAGAGSILEMMSGPGLEALSGSGVRVGNLTYSSAIAGPMPATDKPSQAYQTSFHPGVSAGSQARLVTVQSGQERSGVDLPLRLAPAVRVSGLVTGPSGPVPGTTVRLMPASPDVITGLDDAEVANAVTGSDGTFTVLGVTPGSYVARVERQGRSGMASSSPLLQMFGGGGAPGTPQTPLYGQTALSVGVTDVSGLSVVLNEGARVSGRVQFDGDSPPAPTQMPSWFVQATALGNAQAGVGPQRAALDERAEFKSPGFPGGRYWLSMLTQVPAGGGQWLPRSITASGRDVLNTPLDLGAGDVSDVVITLTNKLAQVAGTVRIDGGTVSKTATVVLIPATYRVGRETAPARRPRQVQASDLGAYSFASLVPGDYLIAAVDDQEASDMSDDTYLSGLLRVATRVTLADLDRRTLDVTIVKVPR